jgi:hypothetical protein
MRTMRLAVVLLLEATAVAAQAWPYKGRTFTTEQRAQWECRGGEVVWVDPPSGRWFRKGDGRYADTEDGAYACRAEVDPSARHLAKPKPQPPLVPAPRDED